MTRNELSDLIHKSVGDVTNANKDLFISSFNKLLPELCHNSERAENLSQALHSYSLTMSEITCMTMSEILIDMGLLHICPEED